MENSFFDTPVNRRGTNSYKWDTTPDGVLPMWVADMDFRTAPCIIEALRRRVEHGVFGYTHVPQEYYEATRDWFSRRHGWDINIEHIIYTSGVVPALSAIIKAVTHPGDGVIVQTPAYNCFFSSIRNNGCREVDNRLVYSKDGYTIDFENLERLAADPSVTAMILCNPHNPAGRVWTPEELRRVGDICLANNVFVISDEIHCELVYKPFRYTPYASLGEKYADNSAVCVSPSKAFNTAGLQIANIVIPDAKRRAAVDRAININEVCDVNPFGVAATVAAYREGLPWLMELIDYLHDNYLLLKETFEAVIPECPVTPLEGTYLAWVNISATGLTGEEVESILVERAGVRLNAGAMYGSGGEEFLRINLACPRSVLREAIQRVAAVIQQLITR
ncbi:MAG: pyridoxal phosphate-dependent aminotransferase [Muribaculaceae bacterium]|nr:pyridoxal phosphate-dependent aminotransferase [Muribaculaceae bacterium]